MNTRKISYSREVIMKKNEQRILDALKILKPNEHRLEIKKLKNSNILIDDAYSSNITGFEEIPCDVLINSQEFKDNLRHPSLFAHSLMDLREKL